MISVSKTIDVNPDQTDVVLTRADVWRGLEAKANNALPFVPSMTYCEVSEREENLIVREIEFRGERFGERVTLQPQESVVFERTSGSVMGTIRNDILEETPGELQLRFSFDLELEGVEAGSEEEIEYEKTMRGDYMKAVDATLEAIRRWVREGDPPAVSSAA
jgi:hypothetical protein